MVGELGWERHEEAELWELEIRVCDTKDSKSRCRPLFPTLGITDLPGRNSLWCWGLMRALQDFLKQSVRCVASLEFIHALYLHCNCLMELQFNAHLEYT